MLEKKIKKIKKKVNKSNNEIIDLAKQASELYTKLIQQAINQCNEDKVKTELHKVEKNQISMLQNIENTDEECIKELAKYFDDIFAIFVNSCKEKTQKTIRSSSEKIWNINETWAKAAQELKSIVQLYDEDHETMQSMFAEQYSESTELIERTLKIK